MAGAAAADEDIPSATDLARDVAGAPGKPVLLLFRAPDCAYCERVAREFVAPLQRNPDYAGKLILRQVNLRSQRRLRDFSGKSVTQAQFARQQGIRFAPTVKLVDGSGNALADPLVGLTTPDFYGAYLERAVSGALAKVRLLVRADE